MNQKGSSPIIVLMGILVLIAIGTAYYLGTRPGNSSIAQPIQQPTSQPSVSTSPAVPEPTSSDLYSGWKTYTSPTEKASFRYPSNWIVAAKPEVESNDSAADQVTIKSPSGSVEINWTSDIGGLGGACDSKAPLESPGRNSNSCPLITVISKTSISGAPDLYVVTGTITQDGQTFTPWLAVQDKSGLMTRRGMDYDVFRSHHNGYNPPGQPVLFYGDVLFSTAGIVAHSSSINPSLSQAEVDSYFNRPEVQQAKLILLSLTDPK